MVEEELSSRYIEYHDIIECISGALDAKDSYTANHSQRVSDMALIISTRMGLKDTDIEKIHIAAHLHDIGKIGIPDLILNKTTKLDDAEWETIKKHPEIGAQILNRSGRLSELSDIVRHHHERYDGKGYPDSLIGVAIPVGARIIAICDSIDAITSNRSYRSGRDLDFCYQEIRRNLGVMYDPMIGSYVLENWDEITGNVIRTAIDR